MISFRLIIFMITSIVMYCHFMLRFLLWFYIVWNDECYVQFITLNSAQAMKFILMSFAFLIFLAGDRPQILSHIHLDSFIKWYF